MDEIRVEGLTKAFDSHPVLEGVDLVVPRGEIVAIVGASGCGKTVLLHIIIGLLAADAGRVLVANHEIEGAPLQDLGQLDEDEMDQIRRHWAVVFQRNALFSGTVYENVALWLREIPRLPEDQIRRRARDAVTAVGLDPDLVLNRDRDELSGGMAKRVAVARAIAHEPMLLFYDEPTTGLDPAHAGQIQDLICQTHDKLSAGSVGRTTVIITHDKDLLYRVRPRVVMLHEGCVHFDGAYAEFMESDSPVIRPYFDLMPGLQRRSVAAPDDAGVEIAWDRRRRPRS